MTESTEQTPQLLKPMGNRWPRMLFLVVVLVSGVVSILCLIPLKIEAIKRTNLSDEAVEPRKEDSETSLQLGRIEGKRYYRKLPFLRTECLNLDVSFRGLALKEDVVEPEDLENELAIAIAKERPKAIYIWVGITTRDGELEQIRAIIDGVSKRANAPHLYCYEGNTIFVDDDDLRSENELP